tara:strand:- start:87 stop:836 length:750 start_codon:yes stop_codon:yes gene_type:complete
MTLDLPLDPEVNFPITCYDNFYEDPDYIREFALSLDYRADSGFFPGVRSECLSTISQEFHYKSVNKILSMFDDFDSPQVSWLAYSAFQKIWPFHKDKNHTLNKGWIHSDYGAVLAAVVYLDPEPDIDTGTSFFKPIESDNFLLNSCQDPNYTPEEITDIRKNVFKSMDSCKIDSIKHYKRIIEYNNSHFYKTMEVKNCYNRLITYDANIFHTASNFYSNDFRLTQVFFIEKMNAPTDKIPKDKCNRYGI